MGASLCRLCVSNIFCVRAGFGMDASHIFPQSMLAFTSLIGGVIIIVVSGPCTGCEASSLLCGCHQPVESRVCSPVVGVDRVVFDQALLPLSACRAPKKVTTEASEGHAVTVNLCTTHGSVCGSTQKQPNVMSLSPLCSSQV